MRVLVRFGGVSGWHAYDTWEGQTPEQLIANLVARAATATDEDLAAIEATRVQVLPVAWRMANGWEPVRSFLARYGEPDPDRTVRRLRRR